MINRWASDVVRNPPVPLVQICQAILNDITTGPEVGRYDGTSMQVQALLRHAMSEAVRIHACTPVKSKLVPGRYQREPSTASSLLIPAMPTSN